MDEYEEEFAIKDDRHALSNIRYINAPPVEYENLRSVKYLQFVQNSRGVKQSNEENTQIINKKRTIHAILYNSIERLDSLLNFLNVATTTNSIRFKVLNQKKAEVKGEINQLKRLNYKKKLDTFDKATRSFKQNLNKLKENGNKTNALFKELLYLKQCGFLVADSFKFPQSKKENVLVHLTQKTIQNFEILKGRKEIFTLSYSQTGKGELTSSYMNNFKKNFSFRYKMKIKLGDQVFDFPHEVLEAMLDESIMEGYKYGKDSWILYNDDGKYSKSYKEMLKFYLKYFFYFLFKTERNDIIKSNSQSNTFTYKTYNMTYHKYGKEMTLSINQYNYFEISFTLSKERNYSQVKYFDVVPMDVDVVQNQKEVTYNYTLSLIKLMMKNIIYDIKLYKNAKDFQFNSGKNISDTIENGFYVKNMVKIANILVRASIVQTLQKKIIENSMLYLINCSYINMITNTYVHKFLVLKNAHVNNNIFSKIELTLTFYKNMVVTFECRTPYKNNIFLCERDSLSEKKFQTVNLMYLFSIVDNLIKSALSSSDSNKIIN